MEEQAAVEEEAAPAEEVEEQAAVEEEAPAPAVEEEAIVSDAPEVVAVEEEPAVEVKEEQPAAPAVEEEAVVEESAPVAEETKEEAVEEKELVAFAAPRCASEYLALYIDILSLTANEKYSKEDLAVIFDYFSACSDAQVFKTLAIYYGVQEGELVQQDFDEQMEKISLAFEMSKQLYSLFLLEKAADLSDEDRLIAAQAFIGPFKEAMTTLGAPEKQLHLMDHIFSYEISK